MKPLDLFAIGAWALFDHIFKMAVYPGHGDTVPLAMPIDRLETVYYGDCSANVAAVAARLGMRVGLGMVVGDDFITSGYQAHLLNLGIDLSGVEIIPSQKSGHNYLYFDATGDGFCLSHLSLAEDQSAWKIPEATIRSAGAVVINEKYSDYTLAAIRTARAGGILTAINGMVGTAGEKTRAFLESADILFISEGELRNLLTLLGFTDVSELHALGPKRIFATQGARGSRVYVDGEIHQVEIVPASQVIDPSGAGDAYCAGTMSALLRGYSESQAARIGAAVSSFVVEAWGCQTNLPDWDAVQHRLKG